MMNISLNLLSIKILQSCSTKRLSKKDISQNFKRHPIENRGISINELLLHKLIYEEVVLNQNSKKPTTYFSISELGKNWLKTYYK